MPDHDRITDALALGTSRRGFLSRVGKALLATAGAGIAAGAFEADDAAGFHFCGHTYTTGSCPHPTGLPRIDAHGYPLRARDGRPVDDLGRAIDGHGFPVDAQGRRLLDPDGRPLPRAPRSRVCQSAGHRYGFHAESQGSWYRCCGGRVRKLWDCCAFHGTRINGDAALTGYCYGGRKVFCVQYYQTSVP
ncbi:MAG: hypothetical protein ACJ77M_15720, partial [Thermoleophilaceae bacterium]